MYRDFLKRFFDFWIALSMFICIFPILFVVAVVLAIANGGSPFFFQQRPGKGTRIFKIVKFKTMNDKKDNDGKLLSDAERLTKIGRFVRSTSIDELPQLINVIKGDMSFIGPRPLFVEYLPYYTCRERLRHTVRPGITGLAQVNGRNNLGWDDRLEYDVQYVQNISIILDTIIIYKTIVNVLKRKDIVVAYSNNSLKLNNCREINESKQ